MRPFILTCVYHPPNAKDEYHSQLFHDLNSVADGPGDFNAPDVNWSSLVGTTSFYNLLCDFVFHFNLSQLVCQPFLIALEIF